MQQAFWSVQGAAVVVPVGPAGLRHEDDAIHGVAEEAARAVEVIVEVVEEAVVVARLALHLEGDRLQVARLARHPGRVLRYLLKIRSLHSS